MGYGRWNGAIGKEIARWTDWFTDWLFCSAGMHDRRIIPVSFPFSRFFCDVERLVDDPLESVGQGIIYSDFGACNRKVSEKEKDSLFEDFYLPHIDRLRSMLTPMSFLMDCHSFPSDLSDVEICIGINDDWSCPDKKIIDAASEIFQRHGLKTGLNMPYSNSISPEMPFEYPSMMIEVNKKLYLSGTEELDYRKAVRVIEAIKEIYSIILDGD